MCGESASRLSVNNIGWKVTVDVLNRLNKKNNICVRTLLLFFRYIESNTEYGNMNGVKTIH
jgi:hypothetical protein